MTTPNPAPDLRPLVLALADDELVTGHRTSHWTGVAPSLELDLALSSIAQDEINHADTWYQLLVGAPGGSDAAAVDALALGRVPGDYRHATICEQTPGDLGHTLARHWLYDHADTIRLTSLRRSADADVAALADRLVHEEQYHLAHADLWFDRLVDGGEATRTPFAAGLRAALVDAPGLFEPVANEDDLLATGVLPEPFGAMALAWLDVVLPRIDRAGLADVVPDAVRALAAGTHRGPLPGAGGRAGVHTSAFDDDVWPEMTHLYRAHPGATW